MEYNTDKLVDSILDSYKKYDATVKINSDNMLNKEILIEVLEEIRRILFPGFFDKGTCS